MKYIKINTPLQVKCGFVVNEPIGFLVPIYQQFNFHYAFDLFKDYDAYNKREDRLKLKVNLPEVPDIFDIRGKRIDQNELLERYLSILKENEYDAEIVDTDAPVNKQGTVKTIKVEVDSQKIKKIINDVIDCLGESPEHKIELLQKLAMYKRPVDFKEQLKQAQDDAQELAVDKNLIKTERDNEAYFVDRIVSALYRIEQSIAEINKSKVTFRTKDN